MLRFNSISMFSIILLTTVACKKEYTCNCEHTVIFPAYTNSNNQYVPQEIVSSNYSNTISSKKKNADSDCKSLETSSNQTYQSAEGQGPIQVITQCSLN